MTLRKQKRGGDAGSQASVFVYLRLFNAIKSHTMQDCTVLLTYFSTILKNVFFLKIGRNLLFAAVI